MAKVLHAQLTKVSAFKWESITPLGLPVVLVDNVDCGRRNRLARQRISEGKRRRRKRRIGGFVDKEYGCHRTFISNGGAKFLIKRKTRDQHTEAALPRDFCEA